MRLLNLCAPSLTFHLRLCYCQATLRISALSEHSYMAELNRLHDLLIEAE